MKEEWKFYVKGNASRGVEVIRVLTDLGAKNTGGVRGDCSEYYYFITHDGRIMMAREDSELASIIIDNYNEIKFPEIFKEGYFVVRENGKDGVRDSAVFILRKAVEPFKQDGSPVDLKCYACLFRLQKKLEGLYVDIKDDDDCTYLLYPSQKLRLAAPDERQCLLDQLHARGFDWEDESKKIVTYRWKPGRGQGYYFVNTTCNVARAVNENAWTIIESVVVTVL